MTPRFKPEKIEYFSYTILAIILFTSLYISYTNPTYFDNQFAVEDGFIEWATALLLISCCLTLILKSTRLWKYKSRDWKMGIILLTILFLFAAGEEISWGQRIFNIESNSFFTENNLQQETNLHNLIVGDISINKLIFSKVIFIVLLIYILVLPIGYIFSNWIQKTVDRFAVPIMQAHHVLAFVISTVLIITIPADRKWEVYEFCFAYIFLMIFHNPFNSWIFKNKIPSIY